ncbi:prostatic acid phosphatase-like protein [Dinothrombium tinctorium]|uniref:acid phosphatase n=1 Tax=Dinothrombium tinctorium TaxID=1965070 RepID=A0A443QU78_9ACAR|nr:prostatic acid phosphatase-like protein [Dinothrombium tinctorium]
MQKSLLISKNCHYFSCSVNLCCAVVSRHGDRTPIFTYPNDPYRNESFWPEGWGELTEAGKERMFNLGRYLRRRYSSFLTNNSNETYIRSSEIKRCQDSAKLIATGIYSSNREMNSTYDFYVETKPEIEDDVLTVKAFCPLADSEYNEVEKSFEFKNISERYNNLYKFLTEKSGTDIPNMYQIREMFTTLSIQQAVGYKLPAWHETSSKIKSRFFD